MTLFELVVYATLIILQLSILAVSVFALRKTLWASRFALAARDQADSASVTTTRQLETLFSLYRKTGLRLGDLPATRHWAASPDFLEILFDEVAAQRPSAVVELGSGASTLVVSAALQQNGSGYLYSFDHDDAFADKTRKDVARLGFGAVVTVDVAPLRSQDVNGKTILWYDLDARQLPDRIDFLIVDGPPEPIVGEGGRFPVAAKLFERLADDAFVIFDDANRPGEQRFLHEIGTQYPAFERIRYSAEKGAVAFRKRAAGAAA